MDNWIEKSICRGAEYQVGRRSASRSVNNPTYSLTAIAFGLGQKEGVFADRPFPEVLYTVRSFEPVEQVVNLNPEILCRFRPW